MVTHDPVDAYALADRVAVMDAGRIVQLGTIAEVTAHPRSRYVASLIGTNLVAGDIVDNVLTTDRRRARRARRRRARAVVRADPPADDRRCSATRSTGDEHPERRGPARSPTSTGSATGPASTSTGTLPLTAEITTAALDAARPAPRRRRPRRGQGHRHRVLPGLRAPPGSPLDRLPTRWTMSA